MTAARRWWCVGIGVLLLLTAPMLVRALPATGEDVTAVALLDRIQGSRDVSFSGYVESAGAVALPTSDELSGLTKLLGSTNKVRVWWRDRTSWRVATVRPTGETDLVHSGNGMLRWVYESKNVTRVPDATVRLPNTADLLPNELARRVLAGARPGELSRLPARRIAGHDALGLRLRPADPQGSIGRVDVFADRESGMPVRVQMFARGRATPSLTSGFVDLTVGRPSAPVLEFSPPHDAYVRTEQIVDLADAANRFAARRPPVSLAGLRVRPGGSSASVGVYGRGPTVLLAIPLWSRTAHRLCQDLEGRPGSLEIPEGILVAADPLRMLLASPEPNDTSWLLAGTVTRSTLVDAAHELADNRPRLRLR